MRPFHFLLYISVIARVTFLHFPQFTYNPVSPHRKISLNITCTGLSDQSVIVYHTQKAPLLQEFSAYLIIILYTRIENCQTDKIIRSAVFSERAYTVPDTGKSLL